MKIDKAIEILENHNDKANTLLYPELTEAIKLGIEALLRERNSRINPGAYRNLPLPGED